MKQFYTFFFEKKWNRKFRIYYFTNERSLFNSNYTEEFKK